MKKPECINQHEPTQEEIAYNPFGTILESILRKGAQQLLQCAVENEVSECIEHYQHKKNELGNQLVVRNGHHKAREIITGLGPIAVKQPRYTSPQSQDQFFSEIRYTSSSSSLSFFFGSFFFLC